MANFRDALAALGRGQLGKEGLRLQQGGARYSWDGQSAYGMIERSSWEDMTRFE